MSTQPKTFITVEEYLLAEQSSEVRHEYFNGEVFATAGGTPTHAAIAVNLTAALRAKLRGTGCRIYGSDLGVKVAPRHWTYPDLSITCAQHFDRNFLENPHALIEILSDSTEAYDRGRKFQSYRQLSSLQHYILLAQERMYIENYRRGPGESWTMQDSHSPEHSLEIHLPNSEPISVALSDIYEDVQFEEAHLD